jgi:leader peptidase (prepilin peptidase)/N-methyltransferase
MRPVVTLACAVLAASLSAVLPRALPTAGRPPPRCGRWLVVAGAAAGAAVGWRFAGADPPLLAAWLLVAALAAPLTAADVAWLRLPDALVLPAAAGTLALLGLAAAGVRGGTAGRALAAGALLFGAHAALALLPRSALGFGDVKLAGWLGLPLGWLGWPAVAVGALLPYLLAGPVAAALLVTGRARRDTPLPFGPYLLAGALLAALFVGRAGP